ncbi:WD40-repeat-containing domain protein [Bombardia bombarda]|uniref:WD40-repeat-containing domain protein n=1 Tax=Bombardia bombarda TaxID=252184 RepID=A0AA40CFU3_9PEZI|nr:WD40-repeat-containing domain protein [Bombardia bombarda]
MAQPSLNLLATSDNPDGAFPGRQPDIGDRSFFRSLQWSADGTTLFTSSSTNRICTFVLPEGLLEPRQEPVLLKAHGTLVLAEPTNAIAPCPYFALENPATQVILTASSDHPIHLRHAFPQPVTEDYPPSSPSSSSDGSQSPAPSTPTPRQPPPIASFNLIKQETEAYLPVTALIWPSPGTHFIAGTTNRLAIYDVSRPESAMSSEPLLSIATIPSTRHISKGNGIGMRGTVAALAAQIRGEADHGLIAAGTWTRHMGLYDLQRAGECVATWSVAGAATEARVGGKGVVQTVWSPCGRYLVVNERASRGLLVYDVRGTYQLLACLTGRDGVDTNQRLSCDVFPGTESAGGFEVWAGTKDGSVAVWEGVGNQAGAVEPSWKRRTHESAIGAAAIHSSGSVLATCSGSWEFIETNDSDSDSDSDSSDEGGSQLRNLKPPIVVQETSLKVWSITSGTPPDANRSSMNEGGIEA